MKTSRIDGICIIELEKGYKMDVEGNVAETHKTVILKDVTLECENAAFDIEQLLMSALMGMPTGNGLTDKKAIKAEERKDQKYYKSDSPSPEQVKENSLMLSELFRMQRKVKYSELMENFIDILNGGLVCAIGNLQMHKPVWDSLHRDEKKQIVFTYCSFFVNPLSQLSSMESSTEKKGSSKAIEK